jgi:hypothetical protein
MQTEDSQAQYFKRTPSLKHIYIVDDSFVSPATSRGQYLRVELIECRLLGLAMALGGGS